MEEKYSFQQKQIVINDMVKKKIFKQHIVNVYSNIEINNNHSKCLYCNQISLEKYCSNICKNIYETNLLYNNQHVLNIHCIPLYLLTQTSQKIFINLINTYKDILYDKININYTLDSSPLKEYTFKKIFLTIIFIHNYTKIAIENLVLDTIIIKISKQTQIQKNFFHLTDNNKIFDNFLNICLYCNENLNKHILYIHLTNQYVIGKFCSEFCCKVFLSINEHHLQQPYKYFFYLPPINYFYNKDIIKSFKQKNNNIIYNINLHNNEYFDIIETLL